jgi:prophage antirepressor-like protein
MSTSTIQAIEFGFEDFQIRTLIRNGEPWFVAQDVCNVLKITNNRDALLKLDSDEKGVGLTDTLGGSQRVSIINESGLYTLILRCRDAVKKGTLPWRFRKWVTGEVLPSIRKTGSYEAFSPQAQNHREPIDNNDLANIKWLINAVTNRFKFSGKWNAAIWYSLRRATGTPSPIPFSIEDIPVLAEEFTRILTVTSSACELIGNFEKEVLKQVVRNRKDFDQIASQFKEEFESLQFLPKNIESLESFEKFGLARLANRTH